MILKKTKVSNSIFLIFSKKITSLQFISLLFFLTLKTQAQFLAKTEQVNLNTFYSGFEYYTTNTINAPTGYGTVLSLGYLPHAVNELGWRTQLAFGTNDQFFYRQSTNNGGTAWTGWNKVFHSGNLNNSQTDFNANRLIAKELTISQTQTNVLLSATGNSFINSGNFGIGTINPKNKLDVNGTIHSKEVKVDMDGWSDFVFKKEYNLPTLIEVEKYIIEKGHLENIPSEKEVIKNGINLGEMNAKLLQKIEELTLYVIDLNKKLEEQNKELEIIKKELASKK